MDYAEQLKAAAEKYGHCRVAGGLDDEEIAKQILAAAGITDPSETAQPEVSEPPPEPPAETPAPTPPPEPTPAPEAPEPAAATTRRR